MNAAIWKRAIREAKEGYAVACFLVQPDGFVTNAQEAAFAVDDAFIHQLGACADGEVRLAEFRIFFDEHGPLPLQVADARQHGLGLGAQAADGLFLLFDERVELFDGRIKTGHIHPTRPGKAVDGREA